jgi:hypothetical protein
MAILSPFWEFLNAKKWTKPQKHSNDVKVNIVFHVQVNGAIFSTFLHTSI